MQLPMISRGNFLALVDVKSSTLDQRVLTGEAAFALGCERPAQMGEYLVLDAIAMLLASMLNRFAGLELKAAAHVVRERWDDWLKLLAKVERLPMPNNNDCVAVAWLSPKDFRVVIGSIAEITAALAGQSLHSVNFIPMRIVLNQLRINAKLAKPKIKLPEKLAVKPEEPDHRDWRREIRDYQDRASVRAKVKAKRQRALA